MLCAKCNAMFIAICLLATAGCDSDEPLSYCSAEVPCPAGQRCDLATNSCVLLDAGVADGLTPDLNLAVGARCGANGECKSGFCADDRCCTSACAGACKSCALTGQEGTCTLVAKGKDPGQDCAGTHAKCGGTCDGKGACAMAPTTTSCKDSACAVGKLTSHNCDGKGDCVSQTTDCGGYGCAAVGDACKTTCATTADCIAAFECVSGACVNSLANGKSCGTNNKACASGNCVDGVCCSTSACGTCKGCNVSGKEGTCAAVADLTSCGTTKCVTGSKTEQVCEAGVCGPHTASCGNYACNATADDCLKVCKSGLDCAPTAYCLGALCLPRSKAGAKCTGGDMCLSGYCVNGVCCGSASCDTCNRCDLAGKEGTCSAVADKTVCGTPFCSSSPFNQDVETIMICTSGKCTPKSKSCGHYLCDATKTACSWTCKASKDCYISAYCDTKGACLEKKPNGATCAGNDQCKNLWCVEGYCCNSACDLGCGSCKLSGKLGTCSPMPKGTVCDKDKCTSTMQWAFRCSGASLNCTHSYIYCEPYKCDTVKGVCASTCTKSDQCTTGYCDPFDIFSAKNTCAATTSQVCHVHTGACGDGSKAKPFCAIQKCLDKKARYVLVGDGKYSENLVVKADVAVISTGTTGTLVVNGLPQQNIAKVFLTPPANNTAGIAISGKHRVLLYGLDISHGGASASGDLLHISGADKVTLRSCVVHDGKGIYKAGISVIGAGAVTLSDSALYKLEGYGFFSYASTLIDLQSAGIAFAAQDNIKVTQGTLRMRDVLLATGGTAGINAIQLKLDLDRVRTQFNGGYGLWATDCTGHVSNLLAADNTGHGVYLETQTCPVLSNVTMSNNAPSNMAVYDIYCHKSCGAKVHNSIVWSAAASSIKFGQHCLFSHSDVKTGGSAPVAGANNINVNPLFSGTGVHPYTLTGSSPCIDTGDSGVLSAFTGRTKDLQGLPRQVDKTPGGGKLDMGAYEVQ